MDAKHARTTTDDLSAVEALLLRLGNCPELVHVSIVIVFFDKPIALGWLDGFGEELEIFVDYQLAVGDAESEVELQKAADFLDFHQSDTDKKDEGHEENANGMVELAHC
jgi:hypothetical protein